ncbi:amidase [Pseudomonas sp. SZMC_28357]|uniref:amidase n=1 Tax=Pseudomonas sp. SZMC_28357 TaxID=3074380 RepID=UPI0028725053|nr:amidase [Pseudomonas sp. SZMC_28357]MDR9752714.1 amidase [Pseudomonas sp. SZMC_28357]
MSLATQDATAIAKQVQRGLVSTGEVAEAFLAQIQQREPQIQAFVAFDADAVRAQATLHTGQGLLAGVPVGIKDIIDSADQPTQYFSPIYAGHQPSRDAHALTLLRQAGALVMGKTHTTEFAYMHTGPTRNPHDPERTPGSSSAGSAAGMAAGFFAVALGTQTAGSLLKPASYCGLLAFKPSLGLVSLEGIKPLAPSFDTLGWYGRSVRDLQLVARVLIPGFTPLPLESHSLNLGFCRTPRWHDVDPDVAQALEQGIEQLRAGGHRVSEVQLPSEFDGVFDDHLLINDCEGARSLATEFHGHKSQLSPSTLAMIERGMATSWEQESAAKARLAALAPRLQQLCEPFEAMLSPCCGMLAPLGLENTGPSDFIKFWGAFGWPQVNLPLPRARNHLPVGLQVIGGFRSDRQLLNVAEQLVVTLHGEA